MVAKQNILRLQQRKWQWKSLKQKLVLRCAKIESKSAKKSEQDLVCPSHLAEAKEVSQDQVLLQMTLVGIFSFISVETILSPLEVSLENRI